MGDEQRNKDIVRTVERLWIDGKLDQLDQYFAPNDQSHDRPPFLPQGIEGAKIAHQGSPSAPNQRPNGVRFEPGGCSATPTKRRAWASARRPGAAGALSRASTALPTLRRARRRGKQAVLI